jgi:hypothetical protein
MIINDDSRVTNKLETSLTDDARVFIYDHHMFIVQATVVTVGTGREKIAKMSFCEKGTSLQHKEVNYQI